MERPFHCSLDFPPRDQIITVFDLCKGENMDAVEEITLFTDREAYLDYLIKEDPVDRIYYHNYLYYQVVVPDKEKADYWLSKVARQYTMIA